ncbi:armadillo repeat-containing protein 1-like [Huso huso]|uniref:Armadillo repeat-containing protein 1 n=2 Tax=Acipenseridae TaxID=7900 RepID=A0A444UNL2_ACIRT|nr:armadillo repeat-containing protein 1-like [Acipenser ruthenus]XP_033856399.1 armadillo repeat-containing protein 1-like [Acipenser ruthenus]RXM36761.1 Armadillo repeat-containing protein 1 [Acipenser ruthenus]
MSGEPDALAIVNQLRDLAADPLNRRAIVQDQGCLPGLILFLDQPNPQVVYSALLAVRYLAECRSNREKMRGELGMMQSLENVMKKTTTPGETKLLASEIYEILKSSSNAVTDQAEQASYRRKTQFFLGATNKRAKTVVLHIDGLDDAARRSLCEEALLKIKGVISFTFQMTVKRCIVRIRSDLKAEALGTAIASTKIMKAQQIVKGEDGDEVMISFEEDAPVEAEQNTDLPDYLPEEESPSKELDKAVSRVGTKQDASGWLNTAANFLTRSFYW